MSKPLKRDMPSKVKKIYESFQEQTQKKLIKKDPNKKADGTKS